MAYTNERFAPELLMHRDELVRRVRASVDEQQDRIAELGPADALPRMIYETEVERVSFLLRSYLRSRILKIQSQALFLARDQNAQARLSEPEKTFAGQYAALYQRHVDREAWQLGDTSRLPDDLKQITRVQQLATPPNLDSHVFCVATRDCDPFRIEGSTEMVDLKRGQVALLPYAPLRPLIEQGDVLLA